MPAFDFLNNVKSTMMNQLAPEQGMVGGDLPPGYGSSPKPPQLSMPPSAGGNGAPAPQGPPQPPMAPPPGGGLGPMMGGGAPGPGGMAPPGGMPAPDLSQVTLADLLGLGFKSLLTGLYNLQPPGAGAPPPPMAGPAPMGGPPPMPAPSQAPGASAGGIGGPSA